MSLSPAALKALVAAGATAEMIVAAVEAELLDQEAKRAAKRAGATERKRRQREREANVTRDVRDNAGQSVTPPPPSETKVSPTPPSKTQPTPTPPIVPPPPAAGHASKPSKPKPDELSEAVEAIWRAQPVLGGKRRSARTDVAKALAVAARDADPAEIVKACQAYYRLPDCRKDGGQWSKGAEVLLRNDRWREYLPGPPTPPGAVSTLPVTPEQRAHRERHYRATGEWREAWGPPPKAQAA